MTQELLLASKSPYRQELLEKLGFPFQTQAPFCDEDTFKKKIKDPVQLATRLAEEKAMSLASENFCVIGGDQIVSLDQEILGKPGSFEKACEQLGKMQGRSHVLITAICVVHQNQRYSLLDITEIKMRRLNHEQIENYVRMDQPLDCAGSYKIEKSGLVLMDEIKCQDFSAIQGIPLIQLVKLLTKLGYNIPGKGNPLT